MLRIFQNVESPQKADNNYIGNNTFSYLYRKRQKKKQHYEYFVHFKYNDYSTAIILGIFMPKIII